MTAGINALQPKVRELVAAGSGWETKRVVPGNKARPRNKSAYASVLLINDRRTSYPAVRQDEDAAVYATQRRARFSVQWYRAGAEIAGHTFGAWTETELGLDKASDLELAVVTPVEVERIDDIMGDAIEERMRCDLQVDWVDIRSQRLDNVTQFQGDLDFGGQTYTLEDPSG